MLLYFQDIQLRLASLPVPRGVPSTRLTLSQIPDAPDLVLQQLVSVRNLVNQSLDIVDVSTYTGDPLNAGFIFSQLHLLKETIGEARQMLKGDGNERGNWWETSASDNVGLLPTQGIAIASRTNEACRCLTRRPRLIFHSIFLSQILRWFS